MAVNHSSKDFKILERCDLLPGDYIILSKYQEQGIYHLEDWHETHQENIVTELINNGFLDTDYETSDGETSDGETSDDETSDNGEEIEKDKQIIRDDTMENIEKLNKKPHILKQCKHFLCELSKLPSLSICYIRN
eukprot:980505_1